MIDRRRLLQGIDAGAAGLSLPGVLAQVREDVDSPAHVAPKLEPGKCPA